jgi:hypothetical protein
MNEPNYSSMMNAKELVEITPDWNTPIAKGTLVGFKGLGGNKVTAAYPVWNVNFEQKLIEFVLYTSLGGRPCLDGTSFKFHRPEYLVINKEPIVVEILGDETKAVTATERVLDLLNNGGENTK